MEDDEDGFGEAEASRSVKDDGDDEEESPTEPYKEGVVVATRRPLWVVAVSSSLEKGMLGGMMDASSEDIYMVVLWLLWHRLSKVSFLWFEMGEGTNDTLSEKSAGREFVPREGKNTSYRGYHT